jgi:rfaE bifunctional protein kinase chain/domain
MTANDNSKPDKDKPDAQQKSPEGTPQAGQEGQAGKLSYSEIFTPAGKDAKNPSGVGEGEQKSDQIKNLRHIDETPLSSHLLTKELSRDLITSKDMRSVNLNEMKTVPSQNFMSAQGIRAVPQGRKAEYTKEETPRSRSPKELAKQIPPPPMTEAETTPTKEDEDATKDKHEKTPNELQVDDIYSDLIVKFPTKLPPEHQIHDPDEAKAKSVFDQMEHARPHDLGAALAHQISKSRLKQCIENLSNGRLIVVGDLLIDELLEGKPERISREAPVLILEHVDTELIPGGAANTAHNVTALGGHCHAVGVSGMDEYSRKLELLLEKHKIAHSIVHDPSRPTTVKTRILSKAHSLKQQLLRLDRISHDTIDGAIQMLLVQKLEKLAKGFHGIILSDYRAGVICQNVILCCQQYAKQNKLVMVVDAQEGFERFQEVDLITPNQPDAEVAVGYEFSDQNSLFRGGKELLALTGSKAVLITRGSNGMSLFKQGVQPFHLPVFNRSEVFDVTGAGDTVAATMTLAMVTGSSLEEATALGNLAAGIVVRKSGTAVTSQQEMLENLERLNLPDNI